MKYNLPNERQPALTYLEFLCTKETRVEIRELRKRRSTEQNRYLHLILGWFGIHFGYTLNEAKEIFKQINSEIFVNSKNNRNFVKSSADLNTKEMTDSIEKFRNMSAEQGCYLAAPNEQGLLDSIENEMERNKMYL